MNFFNLIVFLVILTAVVICLYFGAVQLYKESVVGSVHKNLHNGLYSVKTGFRTLNAACSDWDITPGTTVTVRRIYGKWYITGVFTRDLEDADFTELNM